MNRVNVFADASSLHGVKYILSENRKKSTRIFWTIALFFSICGFAYYFYTGYYKFMYDPEIVMKARDRFASDFPAPAITICPNLFAKDNLANLFYVVHNFDKIKMNLTKSNCTYLAANLHWCQPTFASAMPFVCPNRTFEELDVLQLINKSALSTSETFLQCRKGACDRGIIRVFTDFGICFVRNTMGFSSIFNTDVIHDDFKCYLKFYNNSEGKMVEDVSSWTPERGYASPEDDYPYRVSRDLAFSFHSILTRSQKENLCALKNFRVYFHKPNEILTPFHESIFLNFDEFMEFRVFPKSHRTDEALRRFSPDQRKCYFEGERQLKFFKSYTKAHCEWECRANATLKKCGCVKFSMPRDNKTKVCSFYKLMCINSIESVFCDCHQPCIDIKYSYKVDKTHFNRRIFERELKDGDVLSWLQVNIETEFVEEIENFLSYKLQNFISDFGGLLGLFMGCSLLSIIEIFYYLFGGIFSFIFSRKPRKTTPIIQVQSAWANNSIELKTSCPQVSNNDILYALNSLTKTVHEIEMRFIKENSATKKKVEIMEQNIKDIREKMAERSVRVSNKYDINKILQTIEIEDL